MNVAFCTSASPDYVEKYQKCISSHIDYCNKHKIDYYLDQGPLENKQTKKEWYWRKVYNILQYFNQYDYVAIIDCDIKFKPNCPDIRTQINNSSIFYVNGISGRPNSGFLIIKTDTTGRQFVDTILHWRGTELPDYAKMKGENGYVIKYLKENPDHSCELSIQWNCSQPEYQNDAFVLHYTNKLAGKENE